MRIKIAAFLACLLCAASAGAVAVRAVHRTHPTTGEAGLWIETTSGLGLVGLAESKWPPVVGVGTETRRQNFETAINNVYQAIFEFSQNFSPGNPLLASPEPGCRASGNTYTCQHTIIAIVVTSVDPIVLGAVTLTEGASREVRVR